MKIIKKNIKLIIGLVLGLIISGISVYAVTVSSSDVTYKNTNVQNAINDLYSKVGNGVPTKTQTITKSGNISSWPVTFTFNELQQVVGVTYINASSGYVGNQYVFNFKTEIDNNNVVVTPYMAQGGAQLQELTVTAIGY